ncbi:nuclear transport factor 2 family protein [Aureispira anguillae]|uniref:DUF4878 domain-containing protein n=1 Tax=Aureispira anguillae TaxID=2864201 RepID=A0A915YKV2_9BACT|nr:hypothetical protein [Aureispira anguillae]BDS14643.1 hypothetical protein AsAng_0054240 [Aureispira anguillae]
MHLFLSLGIAFLCCVACNRTPDIAQNTPEEAVRGLFDALKASDFEKAKHYGTISTKESIQNFATNLKMINEEEKKALLAPFKMEISKVDCSEQEGTTICKLCCSEDDIAIEMIQQDDKWFAQMEFAF